jgi:hypothetical protein
MSNQIKVYIIEIHPQYLSKASNFDIRIKKEEAERLLKEFGGRLPFDIMCKEYGDDDDWVALSHEDLDSETGTLPDDYQTFEMWYH